MKKNYHRSDGINEESKTQCVFLLKPKCPLLCGYDQETLIKTEEKPFEEEYLFKARKKSAEIRPLTFERPEPPFMKMSHVTTNSEIELCSKPFQGREAPCYSQRLNRRAHYNRNSAAGGNNQSELCKAFTKSSVISRSTDGDYAPTQAVKFNSVPQTCHSHGFEFQKQRDTFRSASSRDCQFSESSLSSAGLNSKVNTPILNHQMKPCTARLVLAVPCESQNRLKVTADEQPSSMSLSEEGYNDLEKQLAFLCSEELWLQQEKQRMQGLKLKQLENRKIQLGNLKRVVSTRKNQIRTLKEELKIICKKDRGRQFKSRQSESSNGSFASQLDSDQQ